MSKKYHVSKDGNIRECRAKTEESCRASKISEHFDTKEKAHEFYEKKLSKENGGNFITQSNKNKTASKRINFMNSKDAETHMNNMIEEYNVLKEVINDDEENALRGYSYVGYEAINKFLRGTPLESISSTKNFQTTVDKLDSVFKKHDEIYPMPEKPRKLYRYVKFKTPEQKEEFMKNFTESGVFEEKAFMSTTEDPSFIAGYYHKWKSHINDMVVLEIETKKGLSLQIEEEEEGNLQSWEKERLLPRGMKFVIGENSQKSYKIDSSREKMRHYFRKLKTGSRLNRSLNLTTISLTDVDLITE